MFLSFLSSAWKSLVGQAASLVPLSACDLRHVVAPCVDDPYAGAVKGDGPRVPIGEEGALEGTVAGPELGHAPNPVVRDPGAGAVEGHRMRLRTDGEGALEGAVAGPELGHGVAPTVR